jgi:serine/threonine protein kinase/tetratricopeptide (TPR) repeat protein
MERTQAVRARFGSFELDLRAGELHANGEGTLLPEQVSQVLRLLAERAGDVVTRDELKKKLWPNDTVVEFDHGINSTIKRLRRALGDSADEPRYIETLPRRGYRLMVPVEWVGAADSGADSDFQALQATHKTGGLTGKVASHYRVLEVIGGGGMGLVYRAEDLKLGRSVALKFLPEEVGDDPKARERFEREAHAVSALDHPNICTVYDFDEHEGHPFIAMQLLQGKTLRDHLADGRFRLTQPEGLEIAIQIASGLEAAHEKGIIHRDIKPANIFITEKNVAKILDFGVAKVLEASGPSDAVILSEERSDESKDPYSNGDAGVGVLRLRSSDNAGLTPLRMTSEIEEGAVAPAHETTLTRTGMKLGTAGYMSPEQVRGETLDARTDIFSFGLVLYEMATGERAFSGETEAILHDAIQHREPRPVRELAPEISPKLGEISGKCLEKERGKRFQSAAEIRACLEQQSRASGKTQAKRLTRRFAVAAALVVVVSSAAAGVLYRRAHPTFRLTDKDTIVLADFENKTGDPVFDGSLTWALRIGLEQTPFLNILASDKVGRVLIQAGRDGQEHLTPELAREVCLKTNSTAAVIGTIADAGNRYQIGLRAVRCDTSTVMAKSESTANDPGQIVADLGQAAADLRGKLGEPNTTLSQFNKPLDHATSASVDTLKLYTEALKRNNQKGPKTTVVGMLQVTERDPSFVMAHETLGVYYSNLGEVSAMEGSLTKAFDLRKELTDRERLLVEGAYYMHVTGEKDKAIEVWQEMIREHPADRTSRNYLAWCFRMIGDLEKAAIAAREAIRVDPERWPPYGNLIYAETGMNRWVEAKAVYEEAHSRKLDSDHLHDGRFGIAFLERDQDGMKTELEWEKSDPSATGIVFSDEASAQLYFGHARVARKFLAQAVSKKVDTGFRESAAYDHCGFAEAWAEIGEAVRARDDVASALAMSPSSRDLKICAAFVLARLGNGVEAENMATEIKREKPLGTIEKGLLVPALAGAALLGQEKPAEALNALEPSVPYFRSPWYVGFDGTTTAYLRGISLLKLNRAPEAVVEFQKIIDHPGLIGTGVIGPLAHLYLARAYAMMGDKDAARKSYQDFITLWKDADADIPIYKQAKAEYAKLTKSPQLSAASHQLSARHLDPNRR